MTQNRLAQETSPYLLQHADNPVHWWAWGPEALAEARRSGKPILLSIGYAACHWCHVMAHESFENEAVARLMNELFVNIKVDREERPDIDAIYQQALGLLGEQGGWPLTMFCTPAGEPVWGGTYFPYPARYGRPGFDEVLRQLAQAFIDKKDAIQTNRKALLDAMRDRARAGAASLPMSDDGLPLSLLDQMAQQIAPEIDAVNGGIGRAPKFPSAYVFEFLWRAWLRGSRTDRRLSDAVTVTLDRMCQGGIYDHLGGGFARYSTDNEWLVPHFEKMLYDNAQLVDLLVLVWQETRSPLYAARITETCDWVLREMTAGTGDHRGGFAASFDADSEGEEGLFYVWSAAEIDEVLGAADGAFFRAAYDVTAAGNWEGRNILHRNREPALLEAAQEQRLAGLRATLEAVRRRRVPPAWDDKVLADWNGLMIAALANAGAVMGRCDWLAAARRAYEFVMREMHDGEGRLLHAWRNGQARHRATLDDYACMIRAALVLAEVTGEATYVGHAIGMIALLDRFHADPSSGYLMTASDADDVIVRTRPIHDNATPSGNGLLVGIFVRLWALTGEEQWRTRAVAQIGAFAADVERNFFPVTTLLNGADMLQRAITVVIVGEPSAADTDALVAAVHGVSQPNKVLQLVQPGQVLPEAHPAHGKTAVGGRATAYVCQAMACSAPLHDPEELQAALGV